MDPLCAMSETFRGGGSGGGTGSLAFGIDIGPGIVAGDETELYGCDLLAGRNREEKVES